MFIWLVSHCSNVFICAFAPFFTRLVFQQARLVITNIFQHFHLVSSLVCPLIDVVNRILLLKPFQKGFIFICYSLRFLITLNNIERFSLHSFCSVSAHWVLSSWMIPALERSFELYGRHIVFFVLGKVATRPRQDVRHFFKQRSVGFFNLCASFCQHSTILKWEEQ